jgi:hypothetical protein
VINTGEKVGIGILGADHVLNSTVISSYTHGPELDLLILHWRLKDILVCMDGIGGSVKVSIDFL